MLELANPPIFFEVVVQHDGTALYKLGGRSKGLSTLSAAEEPKLLTFAEVKNMKREDARVAVKVHLSGDAKWLVVVGAATDKTPG